MQALLYLLTMIIGRLAAASEEGVLEQAAEVCTSTDCSTSLMQKGLSIDSQLFTEDAGNALNATAVARGTTLGNATDQGSKIHALYTIGAPATAMPALRNKKRTDGCFSGLRTYNVRKWGNFAGKLVDIHDPVPWAAYVAGLKHANMNTLASRLYDPEHPLLTTCSESPQEVVGLPHAPTATEPYFWVGGHLTDAYITGLRAAESKFPEMARGAHFASLAYEDKAGEIGFAAKKSGFNVVARAELEPGSDDITYLMQNPDNMKCSLLFRGTDSASDALTDLNAKISKFCGMADDEDVDIRKEGGISVKDGHHVVHEGFRNELIRMLNSSEYKANIKPLLPSCAGVGVVGHSLGGATAELFVACESWSPAPGTDGYEDFELVDWTPATPQQLPAMFLPRGFTDSDLHAITCEPNTGGTCRVLGCDEGRGPTECGYLSTGGKCLCKPGYCSVAGVCVESKFVTAATEPLSTALQA